MRKVFLDNLPTKKYGEKLKINWNKVNGKTLKFQYDEIVDEIKIMNASSKSEIIEVEYKGLLSTINKTSFINCKIGRVIGKCKNRGVVVGLSDIPTTDPWMIPYFQGGYEEAKQYASGSNKRIYPVCPDCKRVREKSLIINDIKRTKSIGCICKDSYSYPKKFMYSLLLQANIDFEMEFDPDWADGRIYDFYIPSLNLIIETDGGFHFEDNRMSGMSLEESKEIDREKDNMAAIHNITMVRIDCRISDFDYIVKNIKESVLGTFINLNEINYEECGIFATKNFNKLICDFYTNNTNLVPKQIASVLKVSIFKVTESLKNGTKLGWCTYDPKENARLGALRGRLTQIEKAENIYVFDLQGNFVKEFQSSIRAEKGLSEAYNEVYLYSRIRKVIKNETYRYKNFYFFKNLEEAYEILKDITYRRMKQKINQYDMSGKFVKQYDYPTSAERETGIQHNQISRCCLRKHKSAGGFIWRYSDDCDDVENGEYQYINNCGKNKRRKIIQYDNNMNFIARYDSIVDAISALGLNNNGSAISMCCRGVIKSAYGYIWEYVDEVDNVA